MTVISDLDLPLLPLEDPALAEDPASYFEEARQYHPWLAKCSFGYVMTQYDAVREFMRHEDKMRMSHHDMVQMMGAAGTPWGDFVENSIQAQSGEEHKRLRDTLKTAFTPRMANTYRPIIRETIADLLDEWVPKAAIDFEEFASYFPITVMCRILGASPDAIPSVRSSLETLGLGASMDAGHLPDFQDATNTMQAFVRDLVAQRRTEARTEAVDLLDKLLETHDEGGLTDDELYNLLIFLHVAGYDTSKNLLTLVMFTLLDQPEVYERCAADIAYCRKAINEVLRYYGFASLPRVIDKEFEFQGVDFPEGTMVLLPWGILGRDPSAFENADEFNPERSDGGKHVAFGLGGHICLGQFLARAQTEEGLFQIAQRMRNPRLSGEFEWRSFTGVWGVRGLPIEFDPAAPLERTSDSPHRSGAGYPGSG